MSTHLIPPQLQLGPGQINVSEDQGGRKPLFQSVIWVWWLGSGPIREKVKQSMKEPSPNHRERKILKKPIQLVQENPDSSKEVLNVQINPTTNGDTEFEAPYHGRIMGLWNACLKARSLNPSIVNAVHYYTFEEEFDYSDKPTLMAFFVNSETLNNKDITDGEKQTYKNWCYANSNKTALRGALVIRLSLVNCPPVCSPSTNSAKRCRWGKCSQGAWACWSNI